MMEERSARDLAEMYAQWDDDDARPAPLEERLILLYEESRQATEHQSVKDA